MFFFKQKPAYELRISDWSSDVCSSDLCRGIDDLTLLALIFIVEGGDVELRPIVPEARLEADLEGIDLFGLHEIDLIGAAISEPVEGARAIAAAVAAIDEDNVGGIPGDRKSSV